MKVFVLGAALALIAGAALGQAAAPAPAGVTGVWQGEVKAGKDAMPIIIRLGAQVNGDSPAERLFAEPGKLEQTGDSYRVTFQSGGEFAGALTKEGKLSGTFSKGGFSAPLVLVKQAEPPKP
ncbi:hypothetical protein [Phenylobacterium sp.]|uniref:hypothetical protein n=1 Tax=Phenylobacterium sp. TaxID=1871053 RepID=UPI002DF2B81C|nr:hypothetical protein [Phenylobacterium sp.]